MTPASVYRKQRPGRPFFLILSLAAVALCACRPQNLNPPATGPVSTPSALDTWVRDSELPVMAIKILGEFPHDPNAYTQGLLFHEGVFYESTGLEGASSVRRVEIETGRTLAIQHLPEEYFGEGLCLFGDRFYQLTWRNRECLVYDLNLNPIKRLYCENEGWGLTGDGGGLIQSDGSSTLYWRDPETFEIVSKLPVEAAGRPIRRLNELEWIDGEIWANVFMTPWIARIDPATGEVKGWVDLQPLAERVGTLKHGEVANGIAWDAENRRLFVTGKHWPRLFEIAAPAAPAEN